jgi:hypothetical protein
VTNKYPRKFRGVLKAYGNESFLRLFLSAKPTKSLKKWSFITLKCMEKFVLKKVYIYSLVHNCLAISVCKGRRVVVE